MKSSRRSWTDGRESMAVELGSQVPLQDHKDTATKIEMCKLMVLFDAAVAISISMGANHSIWPVKVGQDDMLHPFFARTITKRSYAPNELDSPCSLSPTTPELDTPADDVVKQTESERDTGPAGDKQCAFVAT